MRIVASRDLALCYDCPTRTSTVSRNVTEPADLAPRLTRADVRWSALFAVVVFLSRYLTRSTPYFGDGPFIVQAIRDRIYVVEPPGYWLYTRLGSLFPDPVFGLTFSNEVFAGAGAGVFFLLCRKLGLPLRMACAATLAYGSLFFAWFAGDIQTSHGSQMLFAPLTVFCFLCYRGNKSRWLLMACGASFAVGAGMRPSDGAFLAPLFLFMLFQFEPDWKRRVFLLVFTGVLCLGWYIPTQLAMHQPSVNNVRNEMHGMASRTSMLLTGINRYSIANVVRVLLPLLTACWMLVPAMFSRKPQLQKWILFLWIAPGLAFFLFISMAEAQYLTVLGGGIVLLAALARNQRRAFSLLLACFAFNTLLFLGSRPLPSNGNAARAFDFYVVKCCNYGIRHQWNINIGNGGAVPR